MFPPDKSSKWCQSNDPKIVCTPAYWSIKLPKGNYDVFITVGDPKYSAAYSLNINDKAAFNNEILVKNQFET